MTSSQRNVRLRAKSPCGVQSLRVGLLVAAVRVFVIEERNFFQAAYYYCSYDVAVSPVSIHKISSYFAV